MPEINWQIMLSQVLTFLIALAIVWKFGWGPLTGIIRDRQEKVKKTLEDVENSRTAITRLEADYQAKLLQIEEKSAEVIAQARQEANRIKEEIMRNAQVEAMELQRKAHEQIEHESRRIMGEMRGEIIGLSMAVAEKVLHHPLPEEVHRDKFQAILEELSPGRAQRAS